MPITLDDETFIFFYFTILSFSMYPMSLWQLRGKQTLLLFSFAGKKLEGSGVRWIRITGEEI